MTTYKIVRKFFNRNVRGRTIQTGLTLEEAQRWCRDPQTSSSTCTTSVGRRRTKMYGPWFDGYIEE